MGAEYIDSQLLDNYKKAVDASTILSITDPHGNIIYVNDYFCAISGYSSEELIGQPHNIVRHPDMSKEVFADLWKCILAKKTWSGTIKNMKKDKSSYTVKATIFPVLDRYGEISQFVGIRHDISDQVEQKNLLETSMLEQQMIIEQLKKFDANTGLPNHISLMEFLDKRSGSVFSVMGIKIDNLKSIKDTLGHEFSEAYVSHLTKTLTRYTLHIDGCKGLFRIYFDEIVILFDGKKDVYEKLAHEFSHLSRYFFVAHNGISVGSIFTVIIFSDSESIYEKTLSALLFAFDEHRGEVFKALPHSKCFEDKVPTNIYWFTRYSKAIENDEMVPYYQPILKNSTGKIDKFECLARIDGSDGVVSPDKFVALASRAKQIPFLTKAITKKAFEHFADKAGYEFSINVSAMDLQDREMLKHIMYWQNRTNIDPSRVVLEILESEDIYKYHILKNAVAQFKKEGFKIAIDDFGTGYSNFISLYEYKVDYIKIDGSFIKDLVAHLHYLIGMCGAESIAEFVANDKIQSVVKELGVDYSQGYGIGVPSASTDMFFS